MAVLLGFPGKLIAGRPRKPDKDQNLGFLGERTRARHLDNDLEKTKMMEEGKKRPRFILKDLGEVLGIAFFTPLSWIVPETLWKVFSFPAAFFIFLIRPGKTRIKILHIGKLCGGHFKTPRPFLIELTRLASVMEQKIQYLREYCPGGWKPVITIRGLEHIENARKAGKGGILWIAPFFFNSLVLKKALYQAGLEVAHLSAYNHGPSFSRFGFKRVNRIYIQAENKYLKERIVIQPARDTAFLHAGTNLNYVRKLDKILKNNGLVSIRCQPDRALDHQGVLKNVLNGQLPVAEGSPSFALASSCSLMPVFTLRKAPGVFEVVIESPIEMPCEGNRREKTNILIDRYVQIMETYLVKNPLLFIPWHEMALDLPVGR